MFNAIARPFGMLMMFLYTLVNNYGLAIVFFAFVIKAILLPFQMKSKRGMMQQARLQPKIAELQKKHGTNKAKINEETMKIYREAGINPASGCIWGFLPLPIMLALFQVIRQPITTMMGVAAEHLEEGGAITQLLEQTGFTTTLNTTYVQIAQSQWIGDHFTEFLKLQIENLRRVSYSIGSFDLSAVPQWDFLWNSKLEQGGSWIAGFVLFLIPLISGGMQFLATHLNRKMNPPAAVEGQAKSMNTMMMFMPLISVYIAFITPAALGLYWTISTVFQIVQDVWLTKVYTKKIEAEEAVKNAEREKREAEIEAKRSETERKRAEGLVERNPNTAKRKKQKSDRQEQIEKAVEWQKKNTAGGKEAKYEPSRVGDRRFARGRAYDPDRYAGDMEPAEGIPAAASDGEPEDMPDSITGNDDPAANDAGSSGEYGNGDEFDDDDEYGDEYDGDEFDDDDIDGDEYDGDDIDDDEYDDDDIDDEEYDDEYDSDDNEDDGDGDYDADDEDNDDEEG